MRHKQTVQLNLRYGKITLDDREKEEVEENYAAITMGLLFVFAVETIAYVRERHTLFSLSFANLQ